MNWAVLSGGAHKRKVNGILGLLCRQHFPGLVHYQGRYEPAWTWDHYIAANNDQLDRSGRAFENKAERVKGELWDFYMCDEGYDVVEPLKLIRLKCANHHPKGNPG